MRASKLSQIIPIAIQNKLNVLIKGSPGIGKSELVEQIRALIKCRMIICHAVTSDPTDYKGLPCTIIDKDGNQTAEFVPFGDLKEMIEAKELLIVLFDDIGQAAISVQAALMQIVQARQINGKKISDFVRFILCTNSRKDGAGVTGMITPLLSRMGIIVEMEVNADDWVIWAQNNNVPLELIAYIQMRPEKLNLFNGASKEIENFACPRTINNLGIWINAGVIDLEVWNGAVGQVFAADFFGFYRNYHNLKDLPKQVINSPLTAPIPTEIDILYVLCAALAHKADLKNVDSIFTYIARINVEMSAFTVKAMVTKNPRLKETGGFVNWNVSHPDMVF